MISIRPNKIQLFVHCGGIAAPEAHLDRTKTSIMERNLVIFSFVYSWFIRNR